MSKAEEATKAAKVDMKQFVRDHLYELVGIAFMTAIILAIVFVMKPFLESTAKDNRTLVQAQATQAQAIESLAGAVKKLDETQGGLPKKIALEIATTISETLSLQAAQPIEAATAVITTTETVSTTPSVMTAAELTIAFVLYEPEGGIPYVGNSWSCDVAPDEIEVFTGGPASVAGVSLTGGKDRGSVILLLPGEEVVRYTVTNLVTGSNWHGSYRPLDSPTEESIWMVIAEKHVALMQEAPNCTLGTGCQTIDVLIVGPSLEIVAEWTVGP